MWKSTKNKKPSFIKLFTRKGDVFPNIYPNGKDICRKHRKSSGSIGNVSVYVQTQSSYANKDIDGKLWVLWRKTKIVQYQGRFICFELMVWGAKQWILQQIVGACDFVCAGLLQNSYKLTIAS